MNAGGSRGASSAHVAALRNDPIQSNSIKSTMVLSLSGDCSGV